MLSDVVVIGGGVVGLAIAHGLLQSGQQVTVLDAGGSDFVASRGNFGLIWAQGKGLDSRAYAELSVNSCECWPEFSANLQDLTGIDIEHRKPGGVALCFNEQEIEERLRSYADLQNDSPVLRDKLRFELLRNGDLQKRLPGISPRIPGGMYSPTDGHCNPLYLLRALAQAVVMQGGNLLHNHKVSAIEAEAGGFKVYSRENPTLATKKLVIAAGLGAQHLAPMVGLQGHVKPVRGQVLVTERMAPRLQVPTIYARQTGDGTFLLGDSQEDVGYDKGTSQSVMAMIAARAVRTFPFLANVKLVRAWGALRVMSPDGLPVYQQSKQHPGAFVVNCHSGITLAAYHATELARSIARGILPNEVASFCGSRFDV
jgi:glycine/D-amino acid oxidase-like deaminating enzyme